MPPFFNPFDFVIDLAAVDLRSRERETTSLVRVQRLQDAWRTTSSKFISQSPQEDLDGKPLTVSAGTGLNYYGHQIMVHTKRNLVVTCRDRLGLLASMIESLSMGIMSGWIFYQLGTDLSGIRSRQGAMYSACALQGYLILLFETYRLTIDIQIYDRERIEGVVIPISFIVSRRASRFVLEDLPVPFFYSVIFYFMAGFRADADQFFIFFAIQLLLHLTAVNLATVCVAMSRQFMIASLIANLSFTLQTMACGFFINTRSISVWLRWIKWTAYTFYAFGALCTNEFAGHFYGCPIPGGADNPLCLEYTGSFILESLHLPSNWLWRPIVVLVAFVIFFFILSGIVLQLQTTEVEMAKVHTSEAPDAEAVLVGQRSPDEHTITVTLDNFGLDVQLKRLFGKNTSKRILHPVSTSFGPGVLNVIMGPSGSGKSSCLNAMARRLNNSSLVKYVPSGHMRLNGATITDEVVTSICSYVPQDDGGLLSSLTVRETLHFAARLRLPTFLHHEQKIQRAEAVLLKLGLKDCADTLIGSELVKGISGGEKRRVSIAIQILTDPRVLLLDEPTSGLDAFTAFSIIEVLKSLADEGRTIIFSIHQPRSDMFKQFGGILLLAKGGEVVYTGPVSGMLPYFDNSGFVCMESANPADFALDLLANGKPQALKEQKVAPPTGRDLVDEVITPDHNESPTPNIAREKHLELPAALGVYSRSPLPFARSFPILTQRGMINLRRQPNLLTGRISQLVGLGIVLTAFFTPLQNDYYAVQTRVGYIQAMSSMFFVGMLNSIAMWPYERDLFYHEDRDRTYPLEAFFFYYLAIEVPMELVASFGFSLLTVFAVGLPRTASMYFLMVSASFCVISCGESFGILFLTMFSHTGLAVSVMSVVLSISVHLGGVLSINVDKFLAGVNYISPIKWQVGSLLSYSLRDIDFTCEPDQRLGDGHCPIETGEQVLDLYQLNINTTEYAIALLGVTIGYRLLAYAGLRLRRTDWKSFGARCAKALGRRRSLAC
ncbi:hypothetical protein, variant [Exophiala mesophila]|nr:hypothetical protein, variant [Exophiala mesophila]KIV96500.1 hypothetical protein, variant [Exophiala mesophila]